WYLRGTVGCCLSLESSRWSLAARRIRTERRPQLRELYSIFCTAVEREYAVQYLCLRVSGFHILPPAHGQNLIFKSRSGSIGKRCLESGKTVKRRSLKINASDKKKPFQCQKCGRGFTLKRNKDRHVNYECGHEPRFQCPYCGLRSKQTSPVYAHIRKKHPEEEVFIFDMKL
ncbi:zinc finger protein 397-like, partial [Frieseomelitta varia]|uniref:zinc finger protein 397-like n=1 Tax=Frieseomelitta varia TaxID=561572 RepID=UPI001CB68D4C